MRPLTIPILCYHQVRPGGRITPELFAEHLEVLQRGSWETVFLDDVLDVVQSRRTTKAKLVALTFDDGYVDLFAHALPLLERFGMKASVYVVSTRPQDGEVRPRGEAIELSVHSYNANLDSVQRGGTSAHFCNWAELRAMRDAGLVEPQAHSHFHAACYKAFAPTRPTGKHPPWWLDWCVEDEDPKDVLYPRGSALAHRIHRVGPEPRIEPEDERQTRIRSDLTACRRVLTEKLGDHHSRHFAYPWGEYDQTLVETCRDVGFATATTLDGGANAAGTDPLRLARIEVRPAGGRWLASRMELNRRAWLADVYAYVANRRRKGDVGHATSDEAH